MKFPHALIERSAAAFVACLVVASAALTAAVVPARAMTAGAAAPAADDPLFDPSPAAVCTAPGAQHLSSAGKNADGLKSYVFESHLDTFTNKKTVHEAGVFYYKATDMVRVENRSKDYRAGSVVVKEKSGAVRARGGLALAYMTMTLDENSRLISAANGYSVVKGGFSNLFAGANARVARGSTCAMTPSAVPLGNRPGKFVIVEIREPKAGGEALLERILLDPVSNLPSEWALFKNGAPFSNCRFLNIKLNQELKDELFDL